MIGRDFWADFSKSVAVKFGSAAALFVTSSILARELSPHGFGIYTHLFAITTLFASPVSSAVGILLLRELGKGGDPDSGKSELENYVSAAAIVLTALLIIPGSWLVWQLKRHYSETNEVLLLGFALLIFMAATCLNSIRASIFQARGLIAASQYIDSFIRPAIFLALLVMTVASVGLTVTTAILVLTVASVCTLAYGGWVLRQRIGVIRILSPPRDLYRPFIISLWPFLLLGVAQSAYGQLAVILSREYLDPSSVGVLGLAALISSPAMVLEGLASVYATSMIARSASTSIQLVVNPISRLSFYLTLVCGCYLIILSQAGPTAVRVIYGAAYVDAIPLALIICGGQCISAFLGFSGPLLNMRGFELYSTACSLAACVALVILCIILIPRIGLLGAAISTSTALVIWKASALLMARLKLGVWTIARPR